MRIAVLATPRSGSHAFVSTRPLLDKYKFYEIFNVEDLLLQRDTETGNIRRELLDERMEKWLNLNDYITAYDYKTPIMPNSFLRDYDDNLNTIMLSEYPDISYIMSSYARRLENLCKYEDWCIKLMRYHGIPKDIMAAILDKSDIIYWLDRRDRVEQALSLTKMKLFPGVYHTPVAKTGITYHCGNIDYDIFEDSCHGILLDKNWINCVMAEFDVRDKLVPIWYEDYDFSNASLVKNDIHMNYDRNKCEYIWEEVASHYDI